MQTFPNGLAVQLRRTALTGSEEAQPPAARMLSRPDWTERCGVSCSALLGGDPRALARELQCSYNARVPDLRFEWDPRKNAANKRKHGVSFEEARTVFYDDRALLIRDPDEEDEDRFVLLGLSAGLRTLVVCHCYRAGDSVIRIISARKANREERREYERRWKA